MEITLEINKLVKQVGNLEREIYGGKKVDEKMLFNFIELLMSHLIKLDGIVADCYVKLQRRLQKVEGLFIDIMSEEKRLFEDLKSAKKKDKAKLSLMEITLEINKLAKLVGNLERDIYGGKKVDEKMLFNFIELLMSHLIKLDGIVADCYVKLQRRLQVDLLIKFFFRTGLVELDLRTGCTVFFLKN
ncbi:hypothetical protein L1987_52629 [Smallanthus sonchifolius]|uniref:Uncharacterized protein n=1 Tax=Smallanthus sonchifolius TaxID=185202 RepID=A0ACB9ETZ1_9ASTR|nr:hypothetical protein L1987_52629 [Smallanthus sonchifolius]